MQILYTPQHSQVHQQLSISQVRHSLVIFLVLRFSGTFKRPLTLYIGVLGRVIGTIPQCYTEGDLTTFTIVLDDNTVAQGSQLCHALSNQDGVTFYDSGTLPGGNQQHKLAVVNQGSFALQLDMFVWAATPGTGTTTTAAAAPTSAGNPSTTTISGSSTTATQVSSGSSIGGSSTISTATSMMSGIALGAGVSASSSSKSTHQLYVRNFGSKSNQCKSLPLMAS